MSEWTNPPLSRRACLSMLAAAAATWSATARAQASTSSFDQWVAAFRARARARGISDATYTGVMGNIKPDTTVFELIRSQPEFNEQLWQYLNRRVSDWRITTGKEKAKEYAPLFARIEKDYGVDRGIMLGLWGIESAFGDPDVQKNHMRPVIPALAALAWGEPRRRAYWEQELLNALVIIERGWSTPEEMRGSWAGAMGHTQWMPEVWLNVGLDYDGDGRVSPFGKPDDGLAGTAQYLLKRGKYRPGEHWGYEVRGVGGKSGGGASRTYESWQKAGVTRADGKAFPQPNASAKLWVPVPGGPAFLLGPNFYAVRSYNPSMNYTLSIVHLGDRIMGGGPLVQSFPGGERTPTLAEVQEIQKRLTELGFDTGGTDGRVGNDTMIAVRNFQRKVGMQPADGYAGVKLLARLRQGL
ncbi:MAG TPA: lytic murein transglycosylase [Xanthobacteraceae bacterium]